MVKFVLGLYFLGGNIPEYISLCLMLEMMYGLRKTENTGTHAKDRKPNRSIKVSPVGSSQNSCLSIGLKLWLEVLKRNLGEFCLLWNFPTLWGSTQGCCSQVFQFALTLLVTAYVGALEDGRFEKLGARQVAWMVLLSASARNKNVARDKDWLICGFSRDVAEEQDQQIPWSVLAAVAWLSSLTKDQDNLWWMALNYGKTET